MEFSYETLVDLWLVALAILSAVLSYCAQVLYRRYYQQHITFEPVAAFNLSFLYYLKDLLLVLFLFPLGPLLLGMSERLPFFNGLLVIYLLYPLSRAAMSVLFFLYIKYNPHLIAGRATFQFPAVKMLTSVLLIQQIIFLGVISFFVSAEFIYGGITSLTISLVANYFSKQPQVNV